MRMSFLLAFVLSLSAGMGWAEEGDADGPTGPRKDTVLYKVKANATEEAKAALGDVLKKYEIKSVRKLVKGRIEQAKAESAGPASEKDMCKELLATGAVEFAVVDSVRKPIGTPAAADYSAQWHQTKINTPGAWSVTAGNAVVVVAVLDTGVQANHPDLAGNLLLPGKNTADGSTNTSPVHWHGTATSGCVVAMAGNLNGICGTAPNVKVLPVRITNFRNGSAIMSDMTEGIIWAADQGAKVVNLSYEGAEDPAIDEAASYLLSKGGLLVMAAGNDGANKLVSEFPERTSFVAVSATDSNDVLADFSTHGTFVDVAAPGVDIVTTYTSSKYCKASGTSFSSPITAGVAALVYAVNPYFTPKQVEDFIFDNCDTIDGGDANKYGRGRVNAFKAVDAAKTAMNGVSSLAPIVVLSASKVSGTAPLTVNFTTCTWACPGNSVTYSWVGAGGAADGTTATQTFTTAGTYTVKVVVTDTASHLTADDSVTITVTSGGGKPPKNR